MAETPVPITTGSGTASIAADLVAGASYQQIKMVDGTLGSSNALIVNADGTANVRISGSVATAGGTFTGSVSGTVGASIIGIAPVFIVGGSIAGTFTTPNQSVSGTVGASIIGTVPVVQSGTNITSVSGVVNTAGSVVAFQGTSPWIITGSVQGAANQSVSGTLNINSINNPLPVGTNVLGSIAALQGTNPWIITGSVQGSFSPAANQSVSGTVQTDVRSSVAVVIIGGSIAASFTAPPNQSVSGTVNIGTGGPVSVMGTMSVLGTVPVTQATASNPWIITGSVQGSFSPSANQSVSGTVQVDVRSSVAVVIIGGSVATATTNSSVMLLNSANVIGSVAALQGTNPWIVTSSVTGGLFPISGSVAATIVGTPNVNAAGSVVAFQGTVPFITNFQNSSIIAIQAGSVISINIGSTIALLQSPSIVGTYSVAATYAATQKALAVMGLRNDTLASIASSDLEYTMGTYGPAGETVTANAPFTKWVQGQSSVFTTTSQVALAKSGASIFTYVTGVQVANTSANAVLVTFAGGTNSVLGFTIAPANGGSNIVLLNAWKTAANQDFTASISGGIASVFISAEGFIAKI